MGKRARLQSVIYPNNYDTASGASNESREREWKNMKGSVDMLEIAVKILDITWQGDLFILRFHFQRGTATSCRICTLTPRFHSNDGSGLTPNMSTQNQHSLIGLTWYVIRQF